MSTSAIARRSAVGVFKMRTLFVVSLAASLLMVGVGMIVAILPGRVLILSGSIVDVGFLASVFALSYLISQLPVGYMADRIGAKTFLVFGYLAAAGSGVAFYFSGSPTDLYLGRFIQGIGEAPIWALGPAMLSLAYPYAKGRVIGIYNASIHIGLTIGPLLGIYFFTESDTAAPFAIFAALCLSGGIIVAIFLPRTVVAGKEIAKMPTMRELLMVLHSRASVTTLLGILFFGAGYGICISVLPATLAIEKDFDNFSNGIYFSLFYVSISVSQLIVGPLSDKHGRQAYMLSGLLLAGSGFISFEYFTHPTIFFPLTIASIGLGVFCVSSLAYLIDCVPDSMKSTISASYYLAWGLGYFLGPIAVGQLTNAYLILALLMFVEAMLIVTLIRS